MSDAHIRRLDGAVVSFDDRLSTAKRVILIGHGPGVVGVSELLEARSECLSPLPRVLT